MKLSVVIPAHNESESLPATVTQLYQTLCDAQIVHEILVVDDNSHDNTPHVLERLQQSVPSLRFVQNDSPSGYGFAVRKGLDTFTGDAVAIFMADGSDAPADVVCFFRKIEDGYHCVFGSRFMHGAKVVDYPLPKLLLNRAANAFISALFQLDYNDTTNAFKMFRREVIDGVRPLLSHHFNLTVELPLKAIVRGFTFTVMPNSWHNRRAGESKLKIKEMGSRYLFIVLYCFIERWLACGDYARSASPRVHARPSWVDGERGLREKPPLSH
jgi:dolichol-phosphate mannosyltransferase